jgi:nucleoside 2-deoxyribosyltransferase
LESGVIIRWPVISMSKIFYSWQSDIASHKRYLMECLQEAIKNLPNFEVETATRDSRGAVDISQTILKKIDESDIFLADISIINPSDEGRKTPNPNVLYELGYAVGKKGEVPIILVANSDTTDLEKLPFDIRNRRIIARKFDTSSKQEFADELSEIIASHTIPTSSPLSSPYIYLQLAAYGTDGIKFDARNDENQTYHLEVVEIDGQEDEIGRALLPQSDTHNIHSNTLPRPPYQKRIEEMSFTVSRSNTSFRIYQRLILEDRADGQFNLTRIDSNPVLIEQIPKRRPRANVTNLDSTGSVEQLMFEDAQTKNKFVVGVSNSLFGIWGITSAQNKKKAVERIGNAINSKFEGQAKDKYLVDSNSDGRDIEKVIRKINLGELFSA